MNAKKADAARKIAYRRARGLDQMLANAWRIDGCAAASTAWPPAISALDSDDLAGRLSSPKTEKNQKMAALTDVKNQIGNMVIEVTEKVIRKQLENKADQETYIRKLADDLESYRSN
jgi:flagellar biosynthesis/type III secretory pathway protein FliH